MTSKLSNVFVSKKIWNPGGIIFKEEIRSGRPVSGFWFFVRSNHVDPSTAQAKKLLSPEMTISNSTWAIYPVAQMT
jgi:hypothetical protein